MCDADGRGDRKSGSDDTSSVVVAVVFVRDFDGLPRFLFTDGTAGVASWWMELLLTA